jgi:hypothetical protein
VTNEPNEPDEPNDQGYYEFFKTTFDLHDRCGYNRHYGSRDQLFLRVYHDPSPHDDLWHYEIRSWQQGHRSPRSYPSAEAAFRALYAHIRKHLWNL